LLIAEMKTFTQAVLSGAYQAITAQWLKLEAVLGNAPATVDVLVGAHRSYQEGIRRAFSPLSNGQLRNKLGQICASVLRAESLARHFITHAMFVQERQRRERGQPPSTNLPEDRYQSFLLGQLKQLSEHRSGFQALARGFQAELDEFVSILQREAAGGEDGSAGALLAMVDLSGYHSRRIGFDARKYATS
jgi:hypothetical protein